MKKYTIYGFANGQWRGRLSLSASGSTKSKYRYFSGKSCAEVCEKMDRFTARKKVAVSVQKSKKYKITFAQVVDEWLPQMRRLVKPSSAANYEMKIRCHLLPALGNLPLSQWNEDAFLSFIHNKQQENLSARYINDVICLAKNIMKYACKVHNINNSLQGVPLLKKTRTKPELLSALQQKQLIGYCFHKSSLSSMGVLLSLFTGLRVGELCALKWENIDLNNGVIYIRHTLERIHVNDPDRKTKLILSVPKTESSRREIPLPCEMMPILRDIRSSRENYFLSGNGKPIEPRTMQYRFRRMLEEAQLPTVNFHALRHMFASNCIELGFDAKTLSEILGHSSVQITLDRYVHSTMSQKSSYMDRIKIVQ